MVLNVPEGSFTKIVIYSFLFRVPSDVIVIVPLSTYAVPPSLPYPQTSIEDGKYKSDDILIKT